MGPSPPCMPWPVEVLWAAYQLPDLASVASIASGASGARCKVHQKCGGVSPSDIFFLGPSLLLCLLGRSGEGGRLGRSAHPRNPPNQRSCREAYGFQTWQAVRGLKGGTKGICKSVAPPNRQTQPPVRRKVATATAMRRSCVGRFPGRCRATRWPYHA